MFFGEKTTAVDKRMIKLDFSSLFQNFPLIEHIFKINPKPVTITLQASTLIGGQGGAGPSSFHTTLEGPT